MKIDAIEITPEDLIEKAAQKMADTVMDNCEIHDQAIAIITTRINDFVKKKITVKVDTILMQEMGKILVQKITPVDIWGDSTGEPTTIKDQLAESAKKFWQVKVGADGKATNGYGGKPRHEWMMKAVVKEEFDNAIKENIKAVITGFKQALRDDSQKWLNGKINNIFKYAE